MSDEYCTCEQDDHRLIFGADLSRVPDGAGLWQQPAAALPRRVRRALHRALREHLTDKQREAVEGVFFEGLTQEALADRLGVSQQVIQRRLYGAPREGRRVGGAIARLRHAMIAELGDFIR